MGIFRLDGKRVAVTGAASGIGCAIAARFAHAGAEVILLDLNAAKAQEVAAAIASETSRSVASIALDVSEERSIATAFGQIAVSGRSRWKAA